MKPHVNIVVLVDAVGALSDRTLNNGNLSLVDDGAFGSRGQGTTDLCTVVVPGQVVQWTAIAIDVQTTAEISAITFLPPDAAGGAGGAAAEEAPAGEAPGGGHENLDLKVWEGIVPAHLQPGVPYRYRLEVRMHEGRDSVLHIDTPALMCA
ncbi:hypothetical protein [Actinomadura violacea]|uniref:Inclusion body protein n=1 Tax=Actinomadura violacea TaxID=2819934 RepID=A0ABS3RQB8_9ACTN|nr:hypothetical protein [Actinomadura violacea]MBO2458498.1 hypothetical protein [Actinomadura violacea]